MGERRKQEYIWFVTHPEHTTVPVLAPSWELATVQAAAWWGVPWGKVAALCECERKFEAVHCVCQRCGRWYSGKGTLCDPCEKILQTEEQRTRERLRRGGWMELRKRRT